MIREKLNANLRVEGQGFKNVLLTEVKSSRNLLQNVSREKSCPKQLRNKQITGKP